MNKEYSAYPLSWPLGWPRTKSRQDSRFLKPSSAARGYGIAGRRHSIEEAREKLFAELTRLDAVQAVLSTNLALRLDGFPKSGQANPADPGVAVYFKLKGRDIVLPCDRWNHVACNIWAVACHIETLRSQERWGVGSIEQAFAGYMALPPKRGEDCWEILGVSSTVGHEEVERAFRRLSKTAHPDAGSSPEAFHRLQEARDNAIGQIFAKRTIP